MGSEMCIRDRTTPDTTLTADNIGTMFTELSPYSPLRTENSTTHTPIPTVNAMDGGTQQLRPKPILLTALNLKAIFFLIATTLLMKEMIYTVQIRTLQCLSGYPGVRKHIGDFVGLEVTKGKHLRILRNEVDVLPSLIER